MANEPSIQALKNVAFFAPLGENELRELSQSVRVRSFDEGQVIFEQGDPGDRLYIVSSGQVRISHSNEADENLPLAILTVDDFFASEFPGSRIARKLLAAILESGIRT